jgi:hypothetical protein
MNKCIGIIGKIFGHNYTSYIFEKYPTLVPAFTAERMSEKSVNELFEAHRQIKYVVACKRCGITKGEQ